jgi:hypothetical protein
MTLWRIRVEVTAQEWTPGDVWPDGDAPDVPTVEDVMDVLRREGLPLRAALRLGFDAAWKVEEI